MSAPVAPITDYPSVTLVGTHTRIHRRLKRRLDLLEESYQQAWRLPPVVATMWPWMRAEWHRAHWAAHLAAATFTIRHVTLILLMIAAWTCVASRGMKGRNIPRHRFIASQLSAVLNGTAACTLVLWIGRMTLGPLGLKHASLTLFALRCGAAGTICVLAAAAAYSIAYHLSPPKLYLIVGSRRRAIDAYKKVRMQPARCGKVLGFLDPDDSRAKYLPCDYLGSLDRLESILMRNPVDSVYLALPLKSHYAVVQEAIRICERIGVECEFPPEIFETRLATLADSPRYESRGFVYHMVHDDYRIILKRLIDVTVAGALVLILAPLLLAIAITIKLTSEGPVLFAQQRYGRNRRRFRMYKFRSMVADAEALMSQLEQHNEATGPIFKMKNDPRVTRVGRILRRSSLDELPQLINVLKGDMSLVGPRPMSLRDVHLFSEAGLMRRFSVTPGITGLWQVSGRSNTDFGTWIRFDLEYIDHWSLGLDLRILLRTLPTVLSGIGAT